MDNAASTPMYPEVCAKMLEIMQDEYGNPSSIHQNGRKARSIIEDARKKVARHLNASLGEIFFTSGGTEANNMALKCAVRDLGVQRIITSRVEHHSVLHTVERMASEGLEVDYVSVDRFGRPIASDLERMLSDSDKKTLVSLMHGNNEVGTMIELEEFGQICKTYDALFHSDTVQTVGHFHIDLTGGLVDFITGSAHKFHGPKGAGFIYIRNSSQTGPLLEGGSQERNMRAGTENIAGISGLAIALEKSMENLDEMSAYVRDLKHYALTGLKDKIPSIDFNGDPEKSLYTVLSANFPKSPSSELLTFNLDIEGISASGGSACSSGTEHKSHVIANLNPTFDGTTVRFSLSSMNRREEIDYLVNKLTKIIGR